MKRTYHLVHSEARARAARAVAESPDGYVVTVSEPRRNLEQNAALHALISEIAERREWAGQSWDVETWKRLLVSAWARATGQRVQIVPALDGFGVDMVPIRTSALSKRECSELIDFIAAWDASHD